MARPSIVANTTTISPILKNRRNLIGEKSSQPRTRVIGALSLVEKLWSIDQKEIRDSLTEYLSAVTAVSGRADPNDVMRADLGT